MNLSTLKIATVLACGALSAPAHANVIVNGTFDDTTSGWTGAYGLRDDGPSITTGNYLFFGVGDLFSIEQTYSLTTDETAEADAGNLFFNLSADLFSWQSQNDIATLTAQFLDGADGNLGSVSLTNSTRFDGFWESAFVAGTFPTFQSVGGVMPLLTRSILITIDADRTAGSNNDAYVDNASLTLGPAPVPVPAGAALLLGGLGALSVLRRRA